MIRAAAALALATAGCSAAASPDLADCGGDLRGVWRVDGGDRRYHAIVGRDTWELYPMFDDSRPDGLPDGVVAGPAVIDLGRAPPGADHLSGSYVRRFERSGAICVITAPVTVHDCRGQRISLDVAVPPPPLLFLPCTPAPPGPSATWTLARP